MTTSATETTTTAAGAAQQTVTDPAAQAAAGVQAAAPEAGAAAGQQAAETDAADLTPEEEAALGDPGKRALERIRAKRDELKQQHETTATELEQTRTQLQTALAQIAAGGDQAQQQALQTVTTEKETLQRDVNRLTAVLRNGVAMPKPGEEPAAWAQRVQQTAALLQGDDAAALDNSARVLLSLVGGTPAAAATVTPPPITNGDTQAATLNGGQAGEMSMSDKIRVAAGRRPR